MESQNRRGVSNNETFDCNPTLFSRAELSETSSILIKSLMHVTIRLMPTKFLMELELCHIFSGLRCGCKRESCLSFLGFQKETNAWLDVNESRWHWKRGKVLILTDDLQASHKSSKFIVEDHFRVSYPIPAHPIPFHHILSWPIIFYLSLL